MAIDSVNKRRSIAAYSGIAAIIAPVADGTIGAADRVHLAGLYAGTTPGAPVGPTGTPGDGWGKWPRWGRPWRWFHMMLPPGT